MTKKKKANSEFFKELQKKGQDYCLLGECPSPSRVRSCPEVLAVEGNRVYLRSGTWDRT